MIKGAIGLALLGAGAASGQYTVSVEESRPQNPVISYVDGNSEYTLIFNPTWVEGANGNKEGLLMRTQNCPIAVGDACSFCGGSSEKASVLTFSSRNSDGTFSTVTENDVVFGPSDSTDSWGTEDPRMQYNSEDGLFYMFYTAYNGSAIFLNLATTADPTATDTWTKHGPVFPELQGSKSGALLLRDDGNHFLYWGDSSIRVAKSTDPKVWPDEGEIFIETRADKFDSKLVESGPPPLELSDGNYIFFYNSATLGWPDEPGSAYHPGWVILDKNDPTVILQRSDEPLLSPEFSWEYGVAPYTCNVPNVVFLEAARKLSSTQNADSFEVFFGGADAVIGSAVINVAPTSYAKAL